MIISDNQKLNTEGERMDNMANKIINYINKNDLKNGDRLPSIRNLSTTMETGVNNVRDGMLQLQAMGLIKIYPRSGIFVRSPQSPDPAFLTDVFKNTVRNTLFQEDHNLFSLIEAREVLETEVVGRATTQCKQSDMFPLHKALKTMEEWSNNQKKFVLADEDFHLNIVRILGNQALVIILETILIVLRPYRMTLVRSSEEMKHIEKSHWEIYQSIMSGNAETVRAKMHDHINYLRHALVSQVNTIPKEFSFVETKT